MGESIETKSDRARTGISAKAMLIVIVLLSIAVRMWGLDFGLPQQFHPDEPVVVTRAEYGVATGDWNPRAFHWPSLQMYIVGFEYYIWFEVGKITGAWWSDELEGIPEGDRFIAYALRAPSGFYYLGRFTTVLFGAGIVWLMFIFSRGRFSEPIALLASALVAFHPIMVRHSRYITPDIPSEFFFLAALIFIERLSNKIQINRNTENVSKEGWKWASQSDRSIFWTGILASVMIGLGTGTKYPVAVLYVPLALVILFTPSCLRFWVRLVFVIFLGLMTIIVFAATTPYAIVDYRQFISDIETIGWHVRTGHIGMEAQGGIWHASIARLVQDSGWAWMIIGSLGLLAFFGGFRKTWFILVAFIFVLIGLAPLDVFSDRYLIPLIPFFALGIAWVFDKLREVVRIKSQAIAVLVAVLVFFGLCGYGLGIVRNDALLLTLPDTREMALEWVKENIPAQSIILEEQGGPNLYASELVPLVPEPWYYVTELKPLFARGGEFADPLDTIVQVKPEWVIVSGNVRDRYLRAGAEKEFPELVAVFREYYRLVDNYLNEEARFTPEVGKVAGPEIVIYYVPEGLWDRVLLRTSTVGEVLGQDGIR